jgi:hypothetical protein
MMIGRRHYVLPRRRAASCFSPLRLCARRENLRQLKLIDKPVPAISVRQLACVLLKKMPWFFSGLRAALATVAGVAPVQVVSTSRMTATCFLHVFSGSKGVG